MQASPPFVIEFSLTSSQNARLLFRDSDCMLMCMCTCICIYRKPANPPPQQVCVC